MDERARRVRGCLSDAIRAVSSARAGLEAGSDRGPAIGRRLGMPKARGPPPFPPTAFPQPPPLSYISSLPPCLIFASPHTTQQDAQAEWRFGDAPPPFRHIPVDFVRDNEIFRGMVNRTCARRRGL